MKPSITTLLLSTLLFSHASATTIFTDSFDDASKWANYAGGTNVVNVSGGVLSLSRTATNGQVYMGTVFAEPVTLSSVGDILTFDFRVRLTGNQGNRNNEFNISIGNNNGTPVINNATRADDFGYVAAIGAGTGTSALYRDSGSSNWLGVQADAADGTSLGALTSYALPNSTTTFVDFSMTLERTTTGMDFSLTRNGASLIEISDTSVPNANFYTFNMISFGYYNRGTTNSLDVDSMSVTYTAIPEPGTLALVGIALGILALFRRRS